MKKFFLGIFTILLSVSLFAFPVLASTSQPTIIYSCDSLPTEMTQGEIVTDFGLGMKTLYSDACIKTTGNVILNANIAGINAANYAEDGVVHFYVYVSDISSAGTLNLELAGLSWNISCLSAGWNEIWVPVGEGQGTANWEALSSVRLTAQGSQTYMVDEVELWHDYNLPVNQRGISVFDCDALINGTNSTIITRSEAKLKSINLKSNAAIYHPIEDNDNPIVIAASQFNPVDISSYLDDGYIYFWLYISNVSGLDLSTGQLRLELSSAGCADSEEVTFMIHELCELQNGWNEVYLPWSEVIPSAGAFDATAVNYARVYTTQNHAAGTIFILDEVSIMHGSEVDIANIPTTDMQAVRLAAAQVADTVELNVTISSNQEASGIVETQAIAFAEEKIADVPRAQSVYISATYRESDSTATLTFSQNNASMTIDIPIKVTVVESGPRLVNPLFDNSEQIVAEIIIGETGYEVDNTGNNDTTAIIQSALDACANTGGGTVWLPAGKYRVTGEVKIPAYVTLRGDYQDPDTTDEPEYGTVILADVPSVSEGYELPLFRLSGSSGAVGLTVYYPDQSIDNVKDYQYTFYTEGRGESRTAQMLPVIRNCTMINSYRGIGICDCIADGLTYTESSHEQSILINNKGTFLKNAATIRNGSDVGTLIGLFADSKYWAQAGAGLTQANAAQIESYTRLNGTALVLGDLEGFTFSNINIDSYETGILTEVKSEHRANFYGSFYKINVLNCDVAIQINTIYPADGINIAASTLQGSEYSINKTVSGGGVHLTDVELIGAVSGSEIVQADNEMIDLTNAWDDYYEQPNKPTANLVVLSNLDKTATQDSSVEIQTALNSLSSSGGIVYLPAGHYRLNQALTIPAGVELRGCTASTQVRPERECDGGTILEIRHGYNISEENENYHSNAAIILNGENAGVTGVVIVYRDQTTNSDTYLNTAYAVYAKNATNAYVTNAAIVAPSHGIFFDGCNNHLIQGLSTSCYENIITIKNSTGGSIQRILQNITVTARNSWEWEDWTTSTDGLNLTSVNLDCLVFDNAQETVFAYFDYRGHNTVISNNSQIVTINIGSGGDSTGYIYTVTGGNLTAINTTSTRAIRIPLTYSNNATVGLYSFSTRGNQAQRSFETPVSGQTFILADCDGEILPAGYVSQETQIVHRGKAWRLTGGTTVLELDLVSVDLSEYSTGAIRMQIYAPSVNDKVYYTFSLGNNGNVNKNYGLWTINGLSAGWNEVWFSLADLNEQTGELNLKAVNYIEICTNSADNNIVIDEIEVVGASGIPSGLAHSQSLTLYDCDTASHRISTLISQAEAPNGVILKSEKAIIHDSTHNSYGTAEQKVIMQANSTHIGTLDISDYTYDGWINFYLYIGDIDKVNPATLRYIINSDNNWNVSTNAISWFLADHNDLQEGWNEIWLPITEGTYVGTPNLSAINCMRLLTTENHDATDFIMDEVRIVHKAYVPKSVLFPDPTKMMMNCDEISFWETTGRVGTITSQDGLYIEGTGSLTNSNWTTVLFRGVFENAVDVEEYSGSYLHLSFYVEDASLLGSTLNIELSSDGGSDTEGETEFVVNKSSIKNGWNDIWINFNLKTTTNASEINFFRIFSVGGSTTTVALDNVYVSLEVQ